MADFNQDPNVKRNDFPDDFMFGVGSSAYQVEGAWNADGKGLHIWDCFTLRHPENIADGSNGCVSVDSYHRIKEDVQLLKKMGVKYYRFSLSWSRILPGGKVSMGKNMEGINYYNKLIDELKANDIEPFVTLYHFDIPNALEEEYMGLLSSKIVEDFVNYAELCFWEFGDRVKNWCTINEPYGVLFAGYVVGMGAPGRGGRSQEGDTETEPYIVAYNLLNCHAAAYRKYQEDFKDAQKGKVGITLGASLFKPFGGPDNKDDVQAVEYGYDFMVGLFMEPLTSGDWPKNVQISASAPSKNYPQGRKLPVFTDEQKKKLVNAYDFLGINYYTSFFAKATYNPANLSNGFLNDTRFGSSGTDINGKYVGEPAYEGTRIFLCPLELVDLLDYIKKTYKVDKYIVITENGAPEENDDKKSYEQVRDDAYRLKYIKWHIEAIRRANLLLTSEGGTKPGVMGYFVWSFTDSFEWNSGYTVRFGMNYVDYKNNLHRYPKKSALWFKKFLSESKSFESRKRRLTDVEEDDGVLNGATSMAVEMVKKMKKART